MSARAWTEDLNTGIPAVDEQHKRIINYLNQLDDLEKHEDAAKLEILLDSMLDFCVTCFSMEEDLMEQAKYPFFKAHRMMHETCMRRFSDIRARALKKENTIPELRALLEGYLKDHVMVQDKDYVEAIRKFLKANEVRDASEAELDSNLLDDFRRMA